MWKWIVFVFVVDDDDEGVVEGKGDEGSDIYRGGRGGRGKERKEKGHYEKEMGKEMGDEP